MTQEVIEQKPQQATEKKPELTEEQKQLKKLSDRRDIIRHKDEVLKNCLLLCDRILEAEGNAALSFIRDLTVRAYAHDNSKLSGIEFLYLTRGNEFLDLAHQQHVWTNDHHPEYWLLRGMELNDMPPVAIAEMVCDLKARSSEFGTDLRSYIAERALPRWGASKQGKFAKRVKYYLDLLLDDPF